MFSMAPRHIASDASGLIALAEAIKDPQAMDLLKQLQEVAIKAAASEQAAAETLHQAQLTMEQVTERKTELDAQETSLTNRQVDIEQQHQQLKMGQVNFAAAQADYKRVVDQQLDELQHSEDDLRKRQAAFYQDMDKQRTAMAVKEKDLAGREAALQARTDRLVAAEADYQLRLAKLKELAG